MWLRPTLRKTVAWMAIAVAVPAALSAADVSPAPQSAPTKHRLDPDAEERNKELREAWIESLHRAAPGVNWREIEAANAQENFLRRQVQNRVSVGPWSEVGAVNQTGRNHVAVRGPNGTDLFIGTDRGGLWRGTTSGGPWTPMSDDVGSGVHSLVCVQGPPDVLVTATDNGIVHYSVNDGATWSVPTGLPDDMRGAIRLLNEPGTQTVYLLVDGWRWTGSWIHQYELLHSNDGGQSFTQVHTEPLGSRPDIWIDRVTSGQPLYLMVGATLKRSIDQGSTFSVIGSAPAAGDRAILVGSEDGAPTLYAALRVSSVWKLYRSTDAGASWSFRSNISDFFQTLCASILDKDLLFTGGVNCARSTNGGSSFSLINEWWEYYDDPTNKLHADLFGLESILDAGGSSETFYFDTDGGTYISTDEGQTVTNLTETGLGNGQYYGILTSKTDPRLIAAGSQDQGMQISTPSATLPLQFDQIISGDYGHLTSSVKDHNMLWSVYPGFILLQLAEGSTSLEYPDFPPHGQHSWLPNILADPNDSQRLYFCADHLWQIDRTAPDTYTYTELPQNFDGGLSEFLTAFAISPADHDYWYAVTNEGSLWRSHDAGATWLESVSTGPDDHYFYGTELLPSPTNRDECFVGGSGYGTPAVYRTTDGGTTWTAYNTGMPSTLVYGLAFNNHVEQELYAATEAGPYVYGPGGWTNLLTTQCCAPLTTYWDVEALPNQGIVRFATYGRGIWDYQTASPVDVPHVARPLDGPTLEVFPSPASQRATLAFTLARESHVKLEVFDVAGHRVARPTDGFRSGGRHSIEFDLRADNGRRLESGLYLVRVLTEQGAEVKKLRISR